MSHRSQFVSASQHPWSGALVPWSPVACALVLFPSLRHWGAVGLWGAACRGGSGFDSGAVAPACRCGARSG